MDYSEELQCAEKQLEEEQHRQYQVQDLPQFPLHGVWDGLGLAFPSSLVENHALCEKRGASLRLTLNSSPLARDPFLAE